MEDKSYFINKLCKNIYKQKKLNLVVELLGVNGLSKRFSHKKILDNVNLSIDEGDIYGVIGRSGSGKSTLLNVIVGFLDFEGGRVEYTTSTGKKRDLKDHGFNIRKKVGFTPQGLSFYPKLSVMENLMHFGQMYGLKKSVLKENAMNLLKFTDLYAYRNYLAEELSGGMQKRLDIACSLIHKPKLLVLDEPVMNLDPHLKREILYLIKEVNKQGITVVMASHDLESIEAICNKVAILHKGQLQENGSLDSLRGPYLHKDSVITVKTGKNHEQMLGFVQNLPVSKIIDRRNHILLETSNFNKTAEMLLSYIDQNDLSLNTLDVSQPKLKTIFEAVTQEE